MLDRAGVTGPDGASHNGMWDGSILQVVPGLKIAAPRDAARVAELLNEAVAVTDGPTVVRFPKGTVGGEVEAIAKLGGMDVLREPGPDAARDVLLLGAGPMALMCLAVAERLADHGIGVTVVDPRWIKPVDEAVVDAARRHRLVAVVEDNGRVGGYGDAVSRLLRDRDVDVPVKTFGLPQAVPHARRPRRGAGRGRADAAASGPADHRGGGAPRQRRGHHATRSFRRTGPGGSRRRDGTSRGAVTRRSNEAR